MPIFHYKGLTQQGKRISGVINADTSLLAKERLKKQQIYLTYFSSKEIKKKTKLTENTLLSFTRELSQLLSAGLPLYEAIVTIEEKYQKQDCHRLFLSLLDHLKNGKNFSDALSFYPETFDEVYLSLVKAAEQSGALEDAFEQLSSLIAKKQKLKKQLMSTLSYPILLMAFCTLVTGVLFFVVIPSMQELFEGRTLHPLTYVILHTSIWLRSHIAFLLMIITTVPTFIWLLLRRRQCKEQLFHLLYGLPLVKTITLQSALVRFCRTMFLLLRGGVPLINAISYSRKTLNHYFLDLAFKETELGVLEGKKMSTLLSLSPFIPPLVIRMISVAEETGKISTSMQKLSDIYEEELDRNLLQLTSFLQPALLMLLGAIVGLVVLAILLPLTDVQSFLEQ